MKFLTIVAFFTILACACATFFYRPSSYYGYNRPIVAPYAPYASPLSYAANYVKSYARPYHHYSGYNPIGYGYGGYGGHGYYGYGDYGYYKK